MLDSTNSPRSGSEISGGPMADLPMTGVSGPRILTWAGVGWPDSSLWHLLRETFNMSGGP